MQKLHFPRVSFSSACPLCSNILFLVISVEATCWIKCQHLLLMEQPGFRCVRKHTHILNSQYYVTVWKIRNTHTHRTLWTLYTSYTCPKPLSWQIDCTDEQHTLSTVIPVHIAEYRSEVHKNTARKKGFLLVVGEGDVLHSCCSKSHIWIQVGGTSVDYFFCHELLTSCHCWQQQLSLFHLWIEISVSYLSIVPTRCLLCWNVLTTTTTKDRTIFFSFSFFLTVWH